MAGAGCAGSTWVARGRGGLGFGRRVRVQAGDVVKDSFLECLGTKQAAGDTREDARDVFGAEAAYEREVSGFATLAERGGEFLAVADQLADEAEASPRKSPADKTDRFDRRLHASKPCAAFRGAGVEATPGQDMQNGRVEGMSEDKESPFRKGRGELRALRSAERRGRGGLPVGAKPIVGTAHFLGGQQPYRPCRTCKQVLPA